MHTTLHSFELLHIRPAALRGRVQLPFGIAFLPLKRRPLPRDNADQFQACECIRNFTSLATRVPSIVSPCGQIQRNFIRAVKGLTMDGTHCETWEEFTDALASLELSALSRGSGLLFRGQSNSEWQLDTTPERRWPDIGGVQNYYRRALYAQYQLSHLRLRSGCGYFYALPSKESQPYSTIRSVCRMDLAFGGRVG